MTQDNTSENNPDTKNVVKIKIDSQVIENAIDSLIKSMSESEFIDCTPLDVWKKILTDSNTKTDNCDVNPTRSQNRAISKILKEKKQAIDNKKSAFCVGIVQMCNHNFNDAIFFVDFLIDFFGDIKDALERLEFAKKVLKNVQNKEKKDLEKAAKKRISKSSKKIKKVDDKLSHDPVNNSGQSFICNRIDNSDVVSSYDCTYNCE